MDVDYHCYYYVYCIIVYRPLSYGFLGSSDILFVTVYCDKVFIGGPLEKRLLPKGNPP